MKRILSVVLAIAVILSLSLSSFALSTIAVKSISVDNKYVAIAVGATAALKTTFAPANTTQKSLVYATSNKNIATIDANGVVRGVKAGSAVITVQSASDSKLTAKAYVTVSAGGTPYEVVISYLVGGPIPADLTAVEAELNKITIPKINAKVKLQPMNFGAAMQQQNLILSSGEKVDLMMTFPYFYANFVAQGKIKEIGPALNQYGQGVKDALGGFLQGSLMKGKIYGVRPLSDMGGGSGLSVRTDLLKKYNIDTNLKSWADIETKVFAVLKKNMPNQGILAPSAQNIGIVNYEIGNYVDTLGDSYGVLMNYAKDLKVEDMYSSKLYTEKVNTMRSWYQKGYVIKDAATTQETQYALCKAGKAVAWFTPTKPGISQQESASAGTDVTTIPISTPFSKTSNITLFQWVVPNGSKNVTKDVQMLNLMYTDAAVENLLSWGIEGKHYVQKADGTITWPAGVTGDNSGYWVNQPWMMGNEFLQKIWTGNDLNVWKDTKAFNASILISKAMGFSYDPAPVKTQVTACENAKNQYWLGLESGSVDPAKVLPQFQAKLKASGIEKIIAEKQKQLDAWAKENNIK